MVDPTEMQALAVVSSEIDESKWEVLMSMQCRKAQVYLFKHLNNEAVNLKKECKYMSSNNLALNEEIKHAEFLKKSLQASLATLTAHRIETKHRYLIAKQDKLDLLKRVETNIVKYQDLWLERTKLFEKIPYVQRYHKTNNLTQILNADINELENEIDLLKKLIKEKQGKIQIEDRNKIIELAKYMIEERPRALAAIKNSKKAKPTKTDTKAKEVPKNKVKVDDIKSKFNSDWSFIGSNCIEDTVIMPELQATDDDLDSFSWNLDKLKKQVDSTPPIKTSTNPVQIPPPKPLKEPSYKYETYLDAPTEPRKSFEQNKLIFILQDIALPTRDAEDLVYGANPCEIKEIQSIGGKGRADEEEVQVEDQEEIEEVDMTPKTSQNLVQPPSQYMDSESLEQEATDEVMEVDKEPSEIAEKPELLPNNKNRRISFDLPTIEEVSERSDSDAQEENLTNVTNVTNNSQMETSGDETYNILKEMMFKKHQLDLSPDFTYAKNVPTEKPVVSKFFNDKKESPNANPKQIYPEIDEDDNPEQEDDNIEEKEAEHENMEIDGNIDATPKEPESQRYSGLVRSVLFTHEAGHLPHALNLSINTTDDGEGDFPHCFDSSLLLSPKADQEPMTNDSTEVTSQDVPNFLTGLRKNGFSLFGMSSAVAQNTETGANTQSGGFNFNFGGDNTGEKKRGNFFSMFQ